jgi:hypothetical protein
MARRLSEDMFIKATFPFCCFDKVIINERVKIIIRQ